MRVHASSRQSETKSSWLTARQTIERTGRSGCCRMSKICGPCWRILSSLFVQRLLYCSHTVGRRRRNLYVKGRVKTLMCSLQAVDEGLEQPEHFERGRGLVVGSRSNLRYACGQFIMSPYSAPLTIIAIIPSEGRRCWRWRWRWRRRRTRFRGV